MNRQTSLLTAAAEAFNDGIDPFTSDWLGEHDVTLDECYDLGPQIAVAIHAFLKLRAEMGSDSVIRRQVAGARIVNAVLALGKNE